MSKDYETTVTKTNAIGPSECPRQKNSVGIPAGFSYLAGGK